MSGENIEPEKSFHTQPTVWAAGDGFAIEPEAPVPLAYLDRNCWWRDLPIEALDKHQRAWRRAYVTTNFASMKASIRAGLAVGILPLSALENSMRTLTEIDGFPLLPPTARKLLVNEKSSPDLTSAMADAIYSAQLP